MTAAVPWDLLMDDDAPAPVWRLAHELVTTTLTDGAGLAAPHRSVVAEAQRSVSVEARARILEGLITLAERKVVRPLVFVPFVLEESESLLCATATFALACLVGQTEVARIADGRCENLGAVAGGLLSFGDWDAIRRVDLMRCRLALADFRTVVSLQGDVIAERALDMLRDWHREFAANRDDPRAAVLSEALVRYVHAHPDARVVRVERKYPSACLVGGEVVGEGSSFGFTPSWGAPESFSAAMRGIMGEMDAYVAWLSRATGGSAIGHGMRQATIKALRHVCDELARADTKQQAVNLLDTSIFGPAGGDRGTCWRRRMRFAAPEKPGSAKEIRP